MEQVGVAEEQRGSWLCREIPPSPTDHCPKCHQGLSSPRSRPQLFSGPEGSVLVELSLHEVCVLLSQPLLPHKNHSVVPSCFHQCLVSSPGSSHSARVFGVAASAAGSDPGAVGTAGLVHTGLTDGQSLSKQRALECHRLQGVEGGWLCSPPVQTAG